MAGRNDDTMELSPSSHHRPRRGPQTILIHKEDREFGFTLRHFIVYPPESLLVHHGSVLADKDALEPLDTIFVKNVREAGPADLSGLVTGDRIISVNGEEVTNKTYAEVIALIQNSPPTLHLVVVPKEDDVLQTIFLNTAHCPETNPRPYPSRAESISSMRSNNQFSHLPRPKPYEPDKNDWSRHPPVVGFGSLVGGPRSVSSDYQPLSRRNSHGKPNHDDQPQQESLNLRRRASLEYDLRNATGKDSRSGKERSSSLTCNQSVGLGSSAGSVTSEITDRIRRNVAQKVEFLQRPTQPIWLPSGVSKQVVPKEFYAYPQKFQRTPWPPTASEARNAPCEAKSSDTINNSGHALSNGTNSVIESPPEASLKNVASSVYSSSDSISSVQSFPGMVVGNAVPKPYHRGSHDSLPDRLPSNCPNASTRYGKAFFTTLSRIQENQSASPQGGSFDSYLGKDSSRSSTVTPVPTSSGESTPTTRALKTFPFSRSEGSTSPSSSYTLPFLRPNEQNLHIVSQRTKQFETCPDVRGKLNLYKSELSRISKKTKVPSVATMKHDFEQRSFEEKQNSMESLGSNSGIVIVDNTLQLQRHSCEVPSNLDVPNTVIRSHSASDNIFQVESSENPSGGALPAYGGSGNRTVVVGSSKLHCEPPQQYQRAKPESKRSDRSPRRKAIRQNSYIAAVSRPFEDKSKMSSDSRSVVGEDAPNTTQSLVSGGDKQLTLLSTPKISRPTNLHIPNPFRPAKFSNRRKLESQSSGTATPTSSSTLTPGSLTTDPDTGEVGYVESMQQLLASFDRAASPSPSSVSSTKVTPRLHNDASKYHSVSTDSVVRRKKNMFDENERSIRRISYRKATSAERMYVDSDLDYSDHEHNTTNRKHKREEEIDRSPHKLRSLFAERPDRPVTLMTSVTDHSNKENLASPVLDIIKEGWLNCKTVVVEGKRAADRSWKQVWAILRSKALYMHREKKEPAHTPGSFDEMPGSIPLHSSNVDANTNYNKKKHVFRLTTNAGSEYLLQAENNSDMVGWVKDIDVTAKKAKEELQITNSEAVLRRQAAEHLSAQLSPHTGSKSMKKLGFRNRSPTGHSPVPKTRKPSHQGLDNYTSPKSKTWRGRVARQFRKIHTGSSSSAIPPPPTGGVTIGVPIESCPPSSVSEFIPLIVEMCCRIVEARGLEVIGIYRVPGNTAAVTSLTESINKGFDAIDLQDPRLNDVNVISSLIKSFFRKLPDPLICSELYTHFIEASKIEESGKRLIELKKLVQELPDHNFETLRYLMFHLRKVVERCSVNKMEVRNLAIVFGPTLVRTADDNMVSMVNDMSHQCKIIESFINQCDWFFSDDEMDNLFSPTDPGLDFQENDQTDASGCVNIAEGVGQKPMSEINAKDIVASIISAASRKKQRQRTKSAGEEPEGGGGAFDREILRQAEASRHRHLKKDLSEPPLISQTVNSVDDSVIRNNPPSVGDFTEPLSSSESMKLGDEITLRSYSAVRADTQERVKKFERETRAMLQQVHQDSTRREADQQRVEEAWKKAKQELETEDILDSLADNLSVTITSDNSGAENESETHNRTISHHASISSMNSSSMSLKNRQLSNTLESPGCFPLEPIQAKPPSGPHQHPTPGSCHPTAEILTKPLRHAICPGTTETVNFGLKKLKTSQEQTFLTIGSRRSGSLDSLREVYCQQEKLREPKSRTSFTSSEEGGDLFRSITSMLDQKLSLISPIKDTDKVSAFVLPPEAGRKDRAANLTEGKTFRDPSLHRTLSGKQDKEAVKVCDISSNTAQDLGSEMEKIKNVQTDGTSCEETKSSLSGNGFEDKSKSSNGKREVTVKRSDSLTKNEKTECNIKAKEENSRVKSSNNRFCDERRSTVRELRNKFERKSHEDGTWRAKQSRNLRLKRRHTVGGTKDFDKFRNIILNNRRKERKLSAWEQLQPLNKNEDMDCERNMSSWLKKERLRTSSPDLSYRHDSTLASVDVEDSVTSNKCLPDHSRLSLQNKSLESHV